MPKLPTLRFTQDQQPPDDITGIVLAKLFRAFQYALDSQSDVWDFAVEIEELTALGASNSEFRWLLAQGYADHAQEITLPGDCRRRFRPLGRNRFPAGSCFVLSECGLETLTGQHRDRKKTVKPAAKEPLAPEFAEQDGRPASATATKNGEVAADAMPCWDVEAKELRIGGLLVKHFRWPAPNQETLLTVFQEEGWPHHIDDPLPQAEEQDPRRRLSDTIKCLNRNQVHQLIRFHGDGTGEGVTWDRR